MRRSTTRAHDHRPDHQPRVSEADQGASEDAEPAMTAVMPRVIAVSMPNGRIKPLPSLQAPAQPRPMLDLEDQPLGALADGREHNADGEEQEAEGRGRRPAFIDPFSERARDRPTQEGEQEEQQCQPGRARRPPAPRDPRPTRIFLEAK